MRRIFCAFVTSGLLLGACRRSDGLQAGRVSGLSPVFVIPAEAINVRSGTAAGHQRLTFNLRTKYPARSVIFAISNHFAKAGWRPARNSWFNREEASEYLRGWVQSTV